MIILTNIVVSVCVSWTETRVPAAAQEFAVEQCALVYQQCLIEELEIPPQGMDAPRQRTAAVDNKLKACANIVNRTIFFGR